MQMSDMPKFDSQATLTVTEGYDFTKQEHYIKKKCSACDCFHRRCTFRVWQVIVILLVVAFIIAVMGVLLAMFGPGNSNLRYSEKQAIVAPTERGEGDGHTTTNAPTEATTGGKETTPTTAKQQPVETSTKKAPCAVTTASPPTSPPSDKKPLQCGVAVVGGGTAGLLMAYSLLQSSKETDVCIFEKENRLGGKIFDHRFPDAPKVTVGLGEWHIYGDNGEESELSNDLFTHQGYDYTWADRKVNRVEARGVYKHRFDSLRKSQAFPTLRDLSPTNNNTVKEIAKLVDGRNASEFSTAGTFLSSYLSPEGAKLMEDAYGFKGGYMEAINPDSYKKYLKEALWDEESRSDDFRPAKGMSEIIEKLTIKVRSFNGNIYLKEAAISIHKEGNKFVLLTTNFTVQANTTVLTLGPAALKKMSGDVIENITNHVIFKSIVSVPAFHGAAVYPTAWWNDSVAAQKNNSLEPLEMFISSSNCLGITMPYRGTGPNGRAVLHTIGNNGGCSDKWGNILKVSKDAVDKEMKRALEYKFQRTIPQEPLETVYKYWEEGFWYLQKPGAKFALGDIRLWAKRPLAGSDVFLVGKAFYNFGGWLQDTILSAQEALQGGWNVKFPWSSSP